MRRATWISAVAAALALIAPGAAEAGFSSNAVPVSELDSTIGNGGGEVVAVAPDGSALIAWVIDGPTSTRLVEARRLLPDGALGPILKVSDGTQLAGEPRVVFIPDGRAIAFWAEKITSGPESLRARVINADDSLDPQFTVRNGGVASDSGELSLIATTGSSAIATWHNFVSTPTPFRQAEARRINADGTTGALLVPGPEAGATGETGAADSSGGALLSWRSANAVRARSYAANDTLGTLMTPVAASSAGPKLASDGSDHFRVVYRVGNSPSALEYLALGPDGATAGTAQTLDPPEATLVGVYDIATNAADRSLVAWSRADARARFIGSDGLPEPDTFTTPNAAAAGVAIAADGDGAMVMERTLETSKSILGRVIPRQGAVPGPVKLSGGRGESFSPKIALAPNGIGVVAWEESKGEEGTDPRQIFIRQILPPPSCPDASGTVVQGRPASIALTCTGLQLLAPQIVAAPSHGTLSTPDLATQSVVYTPTPGYEGPDSFTFQGANAGGPGETRTARLTVGKDTVAPVIQSFTKAFKKKKRQFKLSYSEAATATVAIELVNRCPKRARCKKFKKVTTLSATPAELSATLSLPAKVKGKKLRPGRYRATAVAKDIAGNESTPKRLGFTVKADARI